MLVRGNRWSSRPGGSGGRGCITWKLGSPGRKRGWEEKNRQSANFKAFLPCGAYAEGEEHD